MRRVILAIATAALSIVATAVSAQDILSALYSRQPIAQWTGVYVGANGGYGWGRTKMTGDTTLLASGTAHPNGGFAGAQFGGLAQSGIWVFGFEADLQGAWQKGSLVSTGTFGGAPFALNENNSLPWFGTARVRFGIAENQYLVYGTAGFAYGQFRNDDVVTGSLTGTSIYSTYRPGWVVGGGLEVMMTRNWTLKAEYLHIDLGNFTQKFLVTTAGVTSTANIAYQISNEVFRVGFNYYLR